ncbi:MAG: hypothetical protein QM662_13865 [Gordonia sp. (in: high G+C Gram-positive bacteria)]
MDVCHTWMPWWHAMATCSYDDLRRRAAIIEQVESDDGASLWVRPTPVAGFEHFSWANGCGDCAHWFFHPSGQILLTTFDHEDELNVYGFYDYSRQLGFLDGVPAELRRAVLDLPDDSIFLTIRSADRMRSVLAVSGVFWFDGTGWHVAQGLIDYAAANGPRRDTLVRIPNLHRRVSL